MLGHKGKTRSRRLISHLVDFVDIPEIESFKKANNTIKAHWSGIVNYIESRINHAILEKLNLKIQLVKKREGGYKKTEDL